MTEQAKPKTEAPKPPTLGDRKGELWQNLVKNYGKAAVFYANDRPLLNLPRLPFGMFALDFASGGGMPQWGITDLYGPESSGKTTACWSAIASVQRLCFNCFQLPKFCKCQKPKRMLCAWINIEGDLDYDWGKSLGADLSRLVVLEPESGEEALTGVRQMTQAVDVGLIVVDSVAGIVPESELKEDSLWSREPARQAQLITKFLRTIRRDLTTEQHIKHPITILFTNQIRYKVGLQFGNPETVSGGKALQHIFTLNVRLQQSMFDEKVIAKYRDGNKETYRMLATLHRFRIPKSKIRTFVDTGEFIRAKAPIPDLGLRTGDIRDHKTLWELARNFNVIEGKGPYSVFGIKAKTIQDVYHLWREEPDYYWRTQIETVNARKAIDA